MAKRGGVIFYFLALTVIFLGGAICPPAQGAEFVADMVMSGPQGKYTGKIWVKGDKVRQEMQMMGMRQISIIRQDKKVVWNLMPQQMAYMEMPLRPEQSLASEKDLDKAGAKKYLGKEKVGGFTCKKYQVIPEDPPGIKHVVWIATELDYPIKVQTEMNTGTIVMELKNIKKKKIPDSIFQIPEGYEKMNMPMMMPGMQQRR